MVSAERAPAEDLGPMSPFVECVGLTALLGIAATFTGRLLALALPVRFLLVARRLSPVPRSSANRRLHHTEARRTNA